MAVEVTCQSPEWDTEIREHTGSLRPAAPGPQEPRKRHQFPALLPSRRLCLSLDSVASQARLSVCAALPYASKWDDFHEKLIVHFSLFLIFFFRWRNYLGLWGRRGRYLLCSVSSPSLSPAPRPCSANEASILSPAGGLAATRAPRILRGALGSAMWRRRLFLITAVPGGKGRKLPAWRAAGQHRHLDYWVLVPARPGYTTGHLGAGSCFSTNSPSA